MGGDILYFLHRHFRLVFFASLLGTAAGFAALVGTMMQGAS